MKSVYSIYRISENPYERKNPTDLEIGIGEI